MNHFYEDTEMYLTFFSSLKIFDHGKFRLSVLFFKLLDPDSYSEAESGSTWGRGEYTDPCKMAE
jgi:hypothetical protein